MDKHERIAHALGNVFWSDFENTYFSNGRDWWSLSYAPKYPEKTAADIVAFGCPSCHDFRIMGNMQALICTEIKFCTFGDMCDYLKREA